MDPFRRLMASADATIDRVAGGELFDFAPMREVVNGASLADTSRQAVENVTAIFGDQAEEKRFGRTEGISDPPPGRVTASPWISFREVLLPSVRRLDRFTRLADGKVFEVTAVEPDGVGRSRARVKEVVS